MKKNFTLYAVILLICACGFSDGKKVFHVDGTEGSSPSRVLEKARRYIASHPGADVEVVLGAGDYLIEEPLIFDGAGLRGNLTITSEDGASVNLRGDRPVTRWAQHEGDIWKADLKSCGILDYGKPAGYSNRVDLYRNGRRQTLARWPDAGFTKGGKALGATELPSPDWITIHGTAEGELEYLDSRIGNWTAEKDAYCFGYFYWDWSEHTGRIASIDTVGHVLSFEKPYSHYGYKDGCRYYGFNLMCELDSPGEYYIDRDEGVLYWYAPEGVNPQREDMSLSVYNGDHILEIVSAENVNVNGLCFSGGREGGVSVRDGRNVSITNCSFSSLGDIALLIQGGVGHSVDGCTFRELGRGGIHATGGDRKTLRSSEFSVTNTVVEDFALFQRTYQPAIYFGGVGMNISHNCFRNSSSSALRLEGNDITVEYNQFSDLVRESDDQGATDVFYNYSFRRTVYRYNHFKDICGGDLSCAAGIRFDDIISGQIVYGNVFENCGGVQFGGVQIHGGNSNWVSNNLFFDCTYAISCTPWPDEKWARLYPGQLDKCEEVDCFGPLYRSRYPELNQRPDFNHNVNYSSHNLVVNARELYKRGDSIVAEGDTLVTSRDKAISYYLRQSVLESYGLRPIPFEAIGPER